MQSQQTEPYLSIYTQRLLHLPAVPRPALGYPLCSMGTLGGRAEIGDLVTDGSLGVSAVQGKATLELL